jgi:hypothetical protein
VIDRDGVTIPTRLDELTPDWLTAALQPGSAHPPLRVRAARIERIGEGVGFLGEIARVRIEYEDEAGTPASAPRSLVVKLPTSVSENRALGELLGLYWREILFYRELAGATPVRTPIVHHSALTEDPMRVRRNAIVGVMDRLPGSLVDAMMKNARASVATSEHRYVLLIEDLAALRVGDQLRAETSSDCALVLCQIARLHARFWQKRRELARHRWLSDPAATPRIRHRMYLESRANLMKRYGDALGCEGRRWVEFIDRQGLEISKRMRGEAPQTLVHGDLRLDNVFFDDPRSESSVVLADWQLVGRGVGAHDVAYLLCGALDVATSPDVETELLRQYHAALCAAGVGGYPFDALLRDYRRGLLSALQVLCSPGDMELGDARGKDLMKIWIERAVARLSDVPTAALS